MVSVRDKQGSLSKFQMLLSHEHTEGKIFNSDLSNPDEQLVNKRDRAWCQSVEERVTFLSVSNFFFFFSELTDLLILQYYFL